MSGTQYSKKLHYIICCFKISTGKIFIKYVSDIKIRYVDIQRLAIKQGKWRQEIAVTIITSAYGSDYSSSNADLIIILVMRIWLQFW